MRCPARLVAAGLVLSCLAAAGDAFAAVKEPMTGGLLALPGDTPATPQQAVPLETPVPTEGTKGDDTSWGVLVRGGYFGLPNAIADELFVKHPTVKGSSVGAEIRYHGEGGGRGGESIGLAIESAKTEAEGEWQQDEGDDVTLVEGEFSMLAITLTGYWSLFPTWYVHPYAGIGVGAAHVKGHYQDEEERVDADIWVPVLHVPVGLAIELGKSFQLAIEGRFIDGIAVGGALQVRF